MPISPRTHKIGTYYVDGNNINSNFGQVEGDDSWGFGRAKPDHLGGELDFGTTFAGLLYNNTSK